MNTENKVTNQNDRRWSPRLTTRHQRKMESLTSPLYPVSSLDKLEQDVQETKVDFLQNWDFPQNVAVRLGSFQHASWETRQSYSFLHGWEDHSTTHYEFCGWEDREHPDLELSLPTIPRMPATQPPTVPHSSGINNIAIFLYRCVCGSYLKTIFWKGQACLFFFFLPLLPKHLPQSRQYLFNRFLWGMNAFYIIG